MKELIIPIRLNSASAMEQLHALGQQGEHAGQQMASGFNLAQAAATGFMTAVSTQALSTMRLGVQAVSEEFRSVAEYITQTNREFLKFQENLRGAASVAGKEVTMQYTQQQLDLAKQARIVTPDEFATGIKAWNEYGAQYVKETPEGAGKITQERAESLLPTVLGVAKARDIDQKIAGKSLAMIVSKLPQTASDEEIMKTFMETLKVSEMSTGDAKTSMDQAFRIIMPYVGKGAELGEGIKGIRAGLKLEALIQQAHVEDAATFSQILMRGLGEARMRGDLKRMGISDDLDPTDTVKAMLGKWHDYEGAHPGARMAEWLRPLAHGRSIQQFTNAFQTMRGAIEEGHIDQKVDEEIAKAGGSAEARGLIESTIKAGPRGAEIESEAKKSIARAQNAMKRVWGTVEKERTEAEMEEKDEFAAPSMYRSVAAVWRQIAPLETSKDAKDFQITQRTISRLMDQFRAAGGSDEELNRITQGYGAETRPYDTTISMLHDAVVKQTQLHEQSVGHQKRAVELAEDRGRPHLSAPAPMHQQRDGARESGR